MTYDTGKHHRRSIQLKEYDYSRAGAYFITICTYNKECILGDVMHGEMKLNEYGMIVENEWIKTAEIRSYYHRYIHSDAESCAWNDHYFG